MNKATNFQLTGYTAIKIAYGDHYEALNDECYIALKGDPDPGSIMRILSACEQVKLPHYSETIPNYRENAFAFVPSMVGLSKSEDDLPGPEDEWHLIHSIYCCPTWQLGFKVGCLAKLISNFEKASTNSWNGKPLPQFED